MKNPKELTNAWIDQQAVELGLKICYVEVGGVGERDMRKDEKNRECLDGRGRNNYEQDLDIVSRRGEEDVRENGS